MIAPPPHNACYWWISCNFRCTFVCMCFGLLTGILSMHISKCSWTLDNGQWTLDNGQWIMESLVSPNENLGSIKVDEIGANSGQFMIKIGAFLGRKQARLCFILVFNNQIYMLRFFCKVGPFVF